MHDGGGGGFSGGHDGGGFGGHHIGGGGFGGHHHNGGGNHHHHDQGDQGDQGGFFITPGTGRPPRTRGGSGSVATRYIAFGAFLVVFLVLLFVLH